MAQSESPFCDLELRLFQRTDLGYPVEITLAGQQEFPRRYAPLELAEWTPGTDLAADGQRLRDLLLSDGDLRSAWAQARGQAPRRRIRLRLDRAAPELHALPWELLYEDPSQEDAAARPLSAQADTPFSRYLPIALPWGGAAEERPACIRILVTISNPADLGRYELAALDEAQEREGLAALGGPELRVDFLAAPITLERLEAKLREGYHIWHYLGHGAYNVRRRQAALFLQDAQGQTRATSDDELAGMLVGLEAEVKPQLVFLAACQSAKRDTGDAFRGLGPRLVSIGVPAVVAMQDFVSIETARKFSATFYTRLREHGQVDQASNEARSTLLTAGRPDAAVPVLFMRLKSGQLWSKEADARGTALDPTLWDTLRSRVEEGTCVPIIGPRVHGRWLPQPGEIARLWAGSKSRSYPFGDKEDLAHVAQYFDATGGGDWSRDELQRTLAGQFRARLPEALRPEGKFKTLTALVQAALHQELPAGAAGEPAPPPGWARLAADDPNEPHRVLARLNLPLYITTNCDNFMVEALRAEGKQPRREFCRWQDEPQSQEELAALYEEPTPEAPLVYHLFGSDEDKKSLVVSEDHYLDFLTNVLSRQERIPRLIRGMLAQSALMFIGYNLRDWEFRVVLRGLVKTITFKFDYMHVAAQLEDVDEAAQDAVHLFMQKYFLKTKANVFWGSPAQFIAELRGQQAQWEEEGGL
ncbi:MAG TPA: CHAT domain-containing protein [Anaerolineae bacterium]|nr:CHAT domain-containing protein [Anaerolineae bacterium]